MMLEPAETKKCSGCDTPLPVGDTAAYQAHLDADHPSLLVRGLMNNGHVQDTSGVWTLPGIYPAPK